MSALSEQRRPAPPWAGGGRPRAPCGGRVAHVLRQTFDIGLVTQ